MTLAYYDPAQQLTVNVQAATDAGPPATPPAYTSGLEVHDCVVACDLSKIVYGFKGGEKVWQRTYAGWPRGLDVHKGVVWIANGTSIDLVSPTTGDLIRTLTVPTYPSGNPAINSVRVTEYAGEWFATICFDFDGVGSVRLYKLTGSNVCAWTLTHDYTNPFTANKPRCAYYDARWLWVFDTWGHRVYAADRANGGFRPTTGALEVYFPNGGDSTPGDPSLVDVCAEHENRVLLWDYDPTTSLSILASAPVAPFNDATKLKANIVAAEAGTFDPSSTFTPKKSKAAVECSGINTLYSPNSSRRLSNGDRLIADTDNHRVVRWRPGVGVVMQITGFNNPVNAVPI